MTSWDAQCMAPFVKFGSEPARKNIYRKLPALPKARYFKRAVQALHACMACKFRLSSTRADLILRTYNYGQRKSLALIWRPSWWVDSSTNRFLGGGFNFFQVHPYLGRWSNLTSIFRTGWSMLQPPTRFQKEPPNIQWVSNLALFPVLEGHTYIWVFPKIRVPRHGWFMIYNGKTYENGWFGGTMIFGNTHM